MDSIGIVKEVFIPKCEDELKLNKIGFKVYLYDEEKEIAIVQRQDEYNINIYKDDEVIIIKDNNNYDIMLYDGDMDE